VEKTNKQNLAMAVNKNEAKPDVIKHEQWWRWGFYSEHEQGTGDVDESNDGARVTGEKQW